jgi:uncharacterized protein YlxW (UPF0749 family)
MRAVLRDWDVLFDELGAQVAGRKTRVRATYARTAARFRPRRQQAERELAELRDAPARDWRRRTPELERTIAELREIVGSVPIEGP